MNFTEEVKKFPGVDSKIPIDKEHNFTIKTYFNNDKVLGEYIDTCGKMIYKQMVGRTPLLNNPTEEIEIKELLKIMESYDFIICNAKIGSELQICNDFQIRLGKRFNLYVPISMYEFGYIKNCNIYINTYQKWSDNLVVLGKGKFINFKMEDNISQVDMAGHNIPYIVYYNMDFTNFNSKIFMLKMNEENN